MEAFKFRLPGGAVVGGSQPVVKLKRHCYQTLLAIKAETGLSLGAIVEQCVNYALENMEDDDG